MVKGSYLPPIDLERPIEIDYMNNHWTDAKIIGINFSTKHNMEEYYSRVGTMEDLDKLDELDDNYIAVNLKVRFFENHTDEIRDAFGEGMKRWKYKNK